MLSVSAAHQFAVNRWNPGYSGGRVATATSADRGDSDRMQTRDTGQGTLFVCFLGYYAGERTTGTVISRKKN